MLEPNALVKMVRRYAVGDAGYIYSDALVPESPTRNKTVIAPEFTQANWLKRGLHSQGVLMAKEDALRIGGFNEQMTAWEDWDFFVKCVINGICGARLPEPLLLYRKHLGKRSDFGNEHRNELFQELQERYKEYTNGSKAMASCGSCNQKAMQAARQSRVMNVRVETVDKPIPQGYVRLKYTGGRSAPVTFYAHGHPYAAANTPKWQFLDVPIEDADILKSFGVFVEVVIKPLVQATPAPVTTITSEMVKPIVEKIAPVVAKQMPANTPVVSASAMQAAVVKIEEKTGQSIQPKAKEHETTAIAATPKIEIEVTTEKKSRKARHK